MEILIIAGAPYSGKGTQCEILKDKLHYKHISTGDVCREEQNKKSPIGLLMSSYTDKGNLVPDAVMLDFFVDIIDRNKDEKGIILDGYPRTKPQVDDLLKIIYHKEFIKGFRAINITVEKEELMKRAKKRAIGSTRVDDQDPEIHLKRIDVFLQNTVPAIEYMREVMDVYDISGMGEVKNITTTITRTLKGK